MYKMSIKCLQVDKKKSENPKCSPLCISMHLILESMIKFEKEVGREIVTQGMKDGCHSITLSPTCRKRHNMENDLQFFCQ